MGRAPCCEKTGLKKGKWTVEEDEKLVSYITANGEGSWRSLPMNAGLLRCGKSCRLRWVNYLRADVKRGNFTADEEETIVKLHINLGNRWSLIASHLSGRTDNEIKNYWNSHLSRRIYSFRSIVNVQSTLSPPHHIIKRPARRTSKKCIKISPGHERGPDDLKPDQSGPLKSGEGPARTIKFCDELSSLLSHTDSRRMARSISKKCIKISPGLECGPDDPKPGPSGPPDSGEGPARTTKSSPVASCDDELSSLLSPTDAFMLMSAKDGSDVEISAPWGEVVHEEAFMTRFRKLLEESDVYGQCGKNIPTDDAVRADSGTAASDERGWDHLYASPIFAGDEGFRWDHDGNGAAEEANLWGGDEDIWIWS